MATKQEIISGIREQVNRAERIAGQLSDEDWQRGVHEAGWTVRQAYAHLASLSGTTGTILNLIQDNSGAAGSFDVNELNAHQVGQRADRDPEQLLEELRTGAEASIRAIESTDDSVLAGEARNQFGRPETRVGDLLHVLTALHYRDHLDEISQITGKN